MTQKKKSYNRSSRRIPVEVCSRQAIPSSQVSCTVVQSRLSTRWMGWIQNVDVVHLVCRIRWMEDVDLVCGRWGDGRGGVTPSHATPCHAATCTMPRHSSHGEPYGARSRRRSEDLLALNASIFIPWQSLHHSSFTCHHSQICKPQLARASGVLSLSPTCLLKFL